jgi:DNA polymerase I-like protein with 3'-5' exonuclease and polymerase domains
MHTLTFHVDETEEEPMPEGIWRVLRSVIAEAGLKGAPALVTAEGSKTWRGHGSTPPVLLTLGKPHPDVAANEHLTLVPAPSVKAILGTPSGLEMLLRAVRLWDRIVRSDIPDHRYQYDLVHPADPDSVGSLPGHISKLRQYIPLAAERYSKLVVDIETSGNIEIHQPGDKFIAHDGTEQIAEIISLAILFERKSDPEKYDILVWTREALQDPYARARLALTLESGIPLELHNGPFDLPWINYSLREELQYRHLHLASDTLLTHYAMFPGATGHHGLKELAQRVAGAPDWESEAKKYAPSGGHYERIPPNMLYAYNAGDVYWTWMLGKILQQWLADGPEGPRVLLRDTLIPAAAMLVDMEDRRLGWPVDIELLQEYEAELAAKVAKLMAKVRMSVGDPTPFLSAANAKQRALWMSLGKPLRECHDFNPASPMQVVGVLNKFGITDLPLSDKGNPKTSEDALETYIKEHDDIKPKALKFIKRIQDHRHTSKMLSTYVRGPLRDQRDGRIISSYRLFGTVTGRLASSIHTVPRPVEGELNYRRPYICEPGEVIVGADFAQIEARIVAELTGDDQMIADFQIGQPDFFARQMPGAYPQLFRSLDDVFELRDENKARYAALRNNVKPFVHGGNYMRQAGAIAKQYDLPFSEAERMLNAYMERYPNIRPWQAETMDYVRGHKLDEQWGEAGLWTPFGQRFQQGVITEKNGWSVKNAAVAFKPQSCGGHITLHAAMELHNNHLQFFGACIIGLIHDAVYVVCPESKSDVVAKTVSRIMTETAAKTFKRVPFPADSKIGRSWAEV